MNKTLTVMRNEIIITITRKSFLFATFGIPLISTLIFAVVAYMNRDVPDVVSAILRPAVPGKAISEGFVDQSGLVKKIPDEVPHGALLPFPDEAAAKKAVEAGQISSYYLISQDYLVSGKVTYVRPDFNPLSAFSASHMMQWVLQVNLLNGDSQLASQIQDPLELRVTRLESGSAQTRDQNNPLTFFLPYGVTMFYYFVILMSASLLLNSVTKEKENRVIEILMSSISPRQLLGGKIIGLGLVGILQVVLWISTGLVLLKASGRTFNLPPSFQLPPSFLFWGVIFFVLGYILYASLMAAVGALVPNLREASQATFVVILPMLIPLFLVSVLIQDPNGALAIALSLFPLTAPVTMMTRLAGTSVPAWQPALSAVILLLTAFLTLRAVASMFRAQTLLSGQPFQFKRLFNALTGKS